MTDAANGPLSAVEAIERAAPAVVAVHVDGVPLSGLAWREDLVVTDEETLPEGDATVLTAEGGRRRATVLGRDPTTDVALLRVEGGGLAPAALETAPPRVGERVLALGRRDGLPLVAAGIASFVGPAWRSLRGGTVDARIELDLDPPYGAEGGLAVSADGRALGMVVRGPRGRGLVIPAETIERVAARLETHGRIARGYVGLGLRPIRIDGGGRGLLVVSVAEGGPGERAGIRQGDIVTGLDGEAVHGMRGLQRALGPDRVGGEATLAFRRGGEPQETTVSIAERPAG
jgi:S1-C subfamily serine protease